MMFLRNKVKIAARIAIAAAGLAGIVMPVEAQKAAGPRGVSGPPPISRASLAKSATFTVTQTLAPQGGEKTVQRYTIEVKGNQARADYSDASLGTVRYIANPKGVFFYIPGNKSAVKQSAKGGVEGALKLAFAQVGAETANLKRVGAANVSGQPTFVYKDSQNGALVYWGTRPGYKLPVKVEIKNEGGTSTFLVSNIKLNVNLADARFAVPPGTQMVDGGTSPTMPGM